LFLFRPKIIKRERKPAKGWIGNTRKNIKMMIKVMSNKIHPIGE